MKPVEPGPTSGHPAQNNPSLFENYDPIQLDSEKAVKVSASWAGVKYITRLGTLFPPNL
jgi:hypothetical protein